METLCSSRASAIAEYRLAGDRCNQQKLAGAPAAETRQIVADSLTAFPSLSSDAMLMTLPMPASAWQLKLVCYPVGADFTAGLLLITRALIFVPLDPFAF